MKILMIGDIVGSPGRRIVRERLPALRRERGIDAVVANAENAAGGSGLTAAIAAELARSGVDAITLGDHTWGQKEFAGQIDSLESVVRPANYPQRCPGKGWRLFTMPTFRFAVVNLQGRVFMGPNDCPFAAMERALAEIPKDVPVLVDFHAEATSEKISMGWWLDGRVAAVAGTHTHVQTSDATVLPKGTAYITDLGMTGPYTGSIGRKLEPVLQKFTTGMPARFDVADGPCVLEGAIVEIPSGATAAISIEALRIREQTGA
ncbi:MAG: TIGR00282 family metallophosphoesterase [Kiritimatiellae bacterium]|nr:TIGR00282 family metallophosphoesterase [Kiritimatiellia bacterium]